MRLRCDDCRHFVLHHSRTVLSVRLQSQRTPHFYLCLCSLGWLQHWLTQLLTQQGLVSPQASALLQLFVRSFDLTRHTPYCSHFFACTHHSTLQHLPFGVSLRCFPVLRWKNNRTCRSPTALHGGITLATQAFPGSQHCIVLNNFILVRVPRRLHSPCHSHRSRTAQRHQVPSPTRSRHSILLSLIFSWASLVMSVHRLCHCALCLQHTKLPQQTHPRNSPSRNFCSCVSPNTPSGVQLHSAFMKTSVKHRPPATQETRWQSGSPMPPRSSLLQSSSGVASSPESSRRVPGLPAQCRFRRCIHPTPAHRVLSWVRPLH